MLARRVPSDLLINYVWSPETSIVTESPGRRDKRPAITRRSPRIALYWPWIRSKYSPLTYPSHDRTEAYGFHSLALEDFG